MSNISPRGVAVEVFAEERVARIDDLLQGLETLHSCPKVAQLLMAALEDPFCEMTEIEKLLNQDPALTATVLRVVNSSSLGLRNKVSGVRQAAAFLGTRALRLIVLSFGMIHRLTSGAPAEVCSDFWRRALTIGVASARLASLGKETPRDEAYVAGLLADVGVLVLMQAETEAYGALYRRYAHGRELMEAEEREFGLTHADVGERLLSRWRLPPSITEAVARHHATVADEPLVRLVQAGDHMAHVLWVPNTPRLGEIQAFLRREFEINLDEFITFAVECQRDVQAQAELFRVNPRGMVDCIALRARAEKQFREEALEIAIDWESTTSALEQSVPSDR